MSSPDVSRPESRQTARHSEQLDPTQSSEPVTLAEAALSASTERARLQLLASVVKDIDHTYLKQTATDAEIDLLCAEAKLAQERLGTAPKSVCVNSSDVVRCVENLRDTGILVCAVIGFPLGKSTTESKIFETRDALSKGAAEIDMVINVGALKSGRLEYVRDEIAAIANACHEKGALLKVIIEACNLTDEEKLTACHLSEAAGADYVKTSTGTERGGATVSDVALMRSGVSAKVLVKAAGGMKTPEDAIAMRAAGADRFGSSGLLRTILAEVGGTKESEPCQESY